MFQSKSKIAWFAAWPDKDEKIVQINQNAALLKKNNWDVGLVTQFPDLKEIDFSLFDHIIFDNTNGMFFSETEAFKFGFSRSIPSCSEVRQECGGLTYVDNKVRAPHLFSVIRLYALSMNSTVSLDYDVYAYFESDFYATEKLCDLISTEAKEIVDHNLNFVGFESYNQDRGMNACLFMGNPRVLSNYFPLSSVSNGESYYRHYQNESVEDYLRRIFYLDPNSKMYERDKILEFLGEYGVDWDTSHAGFNWIGDIDERTIAAFTTNAPFLKQVEGGYDIFYIFKQELIPHTVEFSTRILVNDDNGTREIFSAEKSLQFNNFTYWENIDKIEFNNGSRLTIENKTTCLNKSYVNQYEISSDFYELSGYYRLRHVL